MQSKKKDRSMDVETLSMYVAAKIKEAVDATGLSQKEFAVKYGKREEWVSAKLKHGRNLTLDDVSFFSHCLDMKVSSFLPTDAWIDLEGLSFAEVIRRICREMIDQEGGENEEVAVPVGRNAPRASRL